MSTPEPDTRDAPGLPFTSLVVTDPPRSNTLEECRHDSGEAVVPALQAPLRRQTSPLVNGQVAVPAGGQLEVPTLRGEFSWS